MKLPVIKKAVETFSVEELKSAENALLEGENLPIPIDGDDEGEQLTHVLAAIFIKETMAAEGIEYNAALRKYTQRVRTSIS